MGTTQAGSAAAIMSTLTTVATAATQMARMAKATETTVGVAQRLRERVTENRQTVMWALLGILGIGIILGLVMAKRSKRSAQPDETAAEAPAPVVVPEPGTGESTGSTESAEASG